MSKKYNLAPCLSCSLRGDSGCRLSIELYYECLQSSWKKHHEPIKGYGDAVLHELWGLARDAPGYDKEKWKQLEKLVHAGIEAKKEIRVK